jgi:hypothetical protein
MNTKTIITMLILSASLLFVGCKNVNERVEDKEYAKELLNQGKFHQARTLLQSLHQENPNDSEVSVLLASAYAGAAGLNVVDAWRMFEPMVFGEKVMALQEENPSNGENQEKLTTDPTEFEKETYRFLSSIAKDFNVLGRMPLTNLAGRSEINEALQVLNKVDSTSTEYGRAKLYSVFLNLFQFSGVLRASFPTSTDTQDYDLQIVLCNFNPTIFFQNLDLGLTYVNNAVRDVKSASEVMNFRKELKIDSLEKGLATLHKYKDRGDVNMGKIIATKSSFNEIVCSK